MNAFDDQPTLTSDLVSIRPIEATDLEGLYAPASDPRVWADHPAKDRYQRDVFERWFADGQENRALVFLRANSDEIIGSSRYYKVDTEPTDICIGFTFIGLDYWGGAYNRAIKTLMLDHAFRSFDKVWFHIAPSNLRSQKATMKLGASYVRDEVNSLSADGVIWQCYALSATDWQRRT
ncbi:MAG: GNAT family N-acetyltransferase [Pseudomonadota bacterium]